MKNNSTQRHEAIQRQVDRGSLIVGVIFTAVSLYFAYGIYTSNQKQVDVAANYERVLATILDGKVSLTSHNPATGGNSVRTYQPRIHYQYEVGGNTYESTRFSYLAPASGDRQEMQAIVARFPVGSKQTAYYDPQNPGEAVLHRSTTRIDLTSGYFWVPFILVSAGLLMILAGWKGWLRRLRQIPGARH